MDIILKCIVTILSAIFLLTGGLALIFVSLDVSGDSNYLEATAKVIVESNYSEEVIQACRDEAQEYGYVLEVDVYGNDVPGTKRYADIRLTYTFEVPLFGYKKEKVMQKVL